MKTDLVVGGFLIHDNKVLLVHHKGSNLWLPVGGHIEKNETPDDAMKREFEEELGVEVELLNRKDILPRGNIVRQLTVPFYVNVHRIKGIKDVDDHDHCCFFYLCKLKTLKDLKINKNEVKDYAWLSIEELNQEHVPIDVRNIALKAFELFNSL